MVSKLAASAFLVFFLLVVADSLGHPIAPSVHSERHDPPGGGGKATTVTVTHTDTITRTFTQTATGSVTATYTYTATASGMTPTTSTMPTQPPNYDQAAIVFFGGVLTGAIVGSLTLFALTGRKIRKAGLEAVGVEASIVSSERQRLSGELEDLYSHGILEPHEYLAKRALVEGQLRATALAEPVALDVQAGVPDSDKIESLRRLKDEGLIDEGQFQNLIRKLGGRRT